MHGFLCSKMGTVNYVKTVNSIMGILHFTYIEKPSKIAKMCFELFCCKNVIFLFSLTFVTVINRKSFYILKTSYFTYRMFENIPKGHFTRLK